jgi:hypothetical protein
MYFLVPSPCLGTKWENPKPLPPYRKFRILVTKKIVLNSIEFQCNYNHANNLAPRLYALAKINHSCSSCPFAAIREGLPLYRKLAKQAF